MNKKEFERILCRYFNVLDSKGKAFNVMVGLGITAVLWALGHLYGQLFSLAVFYILPVGFVAWCAGRTNGIVISFVCAITWGSTQHKGLYVKTCLKTFSVLCFYLIIAMLLCKMRRLIEHERSMSRTDHLTGAINRFAFYEMASAELLRSGRHGGPFTLVYIDIDNFKEINDGYGHVAGDLLLRTVAATLLHTLRRTDVVARMGGDEFIVLLPDTDQDAARIVIPKSIRRLLDTMKDNDWRSTFSVGVLTCTNPPQTIDEMIAITDDLMYEVKKSGKNGIRYAGYEEQLPLAFTDQVSTVAINIQAAPSP